MKKWNFLLFPLLALAVGWLSASLSRAGREAVYPLLNQPPLTPPDWVFPVAWTLLYVLMGVGLALVVNRGGPGTERAAALWALQLAVNFVWSLLFFGKGAYLAALVCLVVLWLLILGMIRAFARVSPAAAWLQVPYLLWVTFAGYLNYGVWALNG